jgi:phenylacetate-CoA ligase
MRLDRAALESAQLERLKALIDLLLAANPFWRPRLQAAGFGQGVTSLKQFRESMPMIDKAELIADQQAYPPYGSNLTFARERYLRLHQTSGTSGQPLFWLDTAESWSWMVDNWCRVFAACAIGPGDRIFFPFSFGPFLGFWTAFEAAGRCGALALPGGGMTSKARLRTLIDHQATALCATPTYALRLAEAFAEEGEAMPASLKKIVVAGEPGGAVPEMRARLASAWQGAEIFDHHGMTEIGPVSTPNRAFPGTLHVIESAFLAEIVDENGQEVDPGAVGELILTNLGRLGSPLLRYRTGDLVRRSQRSAEELGTFELALDGGILARRDDMVVVRGVNLYPSGVDALLRRFDEIAEYRVELRQDRAMTEITLKVELRPQAAAAELKRRIEDALRTTFQLRVPVELVATGTLPRFELKAKRWIRV